jgi:hypothetical protein
MDETVETGIFPEIAREPRTPDFLSNAPVSPFSLPRERHQDVGRRGKPSRDDIG